MAPESVHRADLASAHGFAIGRPRGFLWMSRVPSSEARGAEDLATADAAQRTPDVSVEILFHESDAAVSKQNVDATRMVAARGHCGEGGSPLRLAVANQVEYHLVIDIKIEHASPCHPDNPGAGSPGRGHSGLVNLTIGPGRMTRGGELAGTGVTHFGDLRR